MEPLTQALTQLALDPFDCARVDETGELVLVDHVFSRAELEAALALGSPGEAFVQGFQACVTCSDPGPDGHDPWKGSREPLGPTWSGLGG